MKILKPKDFIKKVLIDEVGGMIDRHPYISFIIMGIGIEFLGKCSDTELRHWNVKGRSPQDFENAIRTIPSLQKYQTYLTTYDLYSSFRCGLAHAVAPKYRITLSSKEELGHLNEHDGRLNLKVEEFYADFKLACEHIINENYPPGDKMNEGFLQVPGDGLKSGTNIPTGITSSFQPSIGPIVLPPPASGTDTY